MQNPFATIQSRLHAKEADLNMSMEKKNLSDLIEYQIGSVVSRTILKKASGTVTLFAFAEGEGLSEHTVPYEAMVYLLDGEAEITVSTKPFCLKGGEMIVLPANEPHALRAVRNFKMLLIMLKS